MSIPERKVRVYLSVHHPPQSWERDEGPVAAMPVFCHGPVAFPSVASPSLLSKNLLKSHHKHKYDSIKSPSRCNSLSSKLFY